MILPGVYGPGKNHRFWHIGIGMGLLAVVLSSKEDRRHLGQRDRAHDLGG